MPKVKAAIITIGAMVIGFFILAIFNSREPSFQCRHGPMMRERGRG
jgi:hypothetical protein